MLLFNAPGTLLSVSAFLQLALALPENRTDPSTNAVVDKGTFANPSVNVRPKFRYWIPDASVDPVVVADDVRKAGEAGAGGLELLGYYLYGGPPSNGAGRGLAAPVDWAQYGFGSPAWYDVFRACAQSHLDNKLIMDFAIGPNQGTGVPAVEDSDGLMWDLTAFNVSVPLGGSFDGILPGWGIGDLLAVVTGLAASSETLTTDDPAGGLPGDLPLDRTQITLVAQSLQDVTNRVGSDGHLSIDFSTSNGTGINNTIFAVYLIHSDFRAQDGPLDLGGPQTSPTSFVQNGSWAVDHFSSLGARTTTNFWEKYILQNGTKEIVSTVGNYAWEDSVEIEANVYWTKNYTSNFLADHGYSVNKWLPILFHRNGHAKNSNPPVWWVTDEPDQGNSHIADYRDTLATGYRAYESALNEWAEEYLSMQFSAQLSYNLPMDMLANVPSVDAPECETLDFSDLIDGYRQYSGPAHLATRKIVSSECGAVKGEAFVQTLPELLWHVKRSYAGSVNQFVFHGLPYSGQYGNTTWPVFTTFNYQYSSMHGPHEPAWEYYRDQLDYVARNNWVLQSGIPKMDIAFWQKMTTYPGHIQARTYEPTDLEAEGYTYDYLSPDNFNLPSARVVDGILAPDAQAFKVMVVRANDSLTIDGATKLIEFAKAGLPIVFAGGIPTNYLGTNNPSSLASTQRDLNATASLSNVHVTSSYLVASTISSLGIQPLTKISTNASWYTYWRSDPSTNSSFVFIYNDAMHTPQGQGLSEGTIEFQITGLPYEYNAWTGSQQPIVSYNRTNTTTTIPLKLAGNQSTIVAFHQPPSNTSTSLPPNYSFSSTSNILGIVNSTTVQLGSGDALTYSDSTGSSKTITPCTVDPFSLTNWTLTAEHWDPPTDLYNITAGAAKHNTTHQLPTLTSWQNISGLQNVSGKGYYTTTFSWPPTSSSNTSGAIDGAYIDFTFIYHTLRASLNSNPLGPLDVTAPMADIGPYLINGTNRLEAVVTTPLGNVLRPIWYSLMTSGEGPGSPDAGSSFPPPPLGEYGLRGDVVITPYRVGAL